jgi:hypothetical protein
MEILCIEKKGPKLNTLERFYVYDVTKKGLQMNDTFTDTYNTIHVFDIVQCSGYWTTSNHPLYGVTPLKTPFGLLIPFITIPVTRNYIHLQLFLTLCHIYTAYNLTRS